MKVNRFPTSPAYNN